MSATASELTAVINEMKWFVSVCVEPDTLVKPVAAPSTAAENLITEHLDPSPPTPEESQAANDERRMQEAEVEHAKEVMKLFDHAIEEVEIVRARVRAQEERQRRENQQRQVLGRGGRRRARVR